MRSSKFATFLFMKWQKVNGIGISQSEDSANDRPSVRCRSGRAVIQRLHDLGKKFVDLRVCSVNVRTLSVTSGKIVKMLERRSVDIVVYKKLESGDSQLELLVGKQPS